MERTIENISGQSMSAEITWSEQLKLFVPWD
jgi:hypothetical protein